MKISLKWMPSTDLEDIDELDNTIIMKYNFAFEVNDLRKTGNEIGRNVEESDRIKKVTTDSDITSWLKNRLGFCLSHFGFQFNTEAPKNYTVQFDVLDYYVLEDNLYRGRLKTKVYLKDNDGNTVWEDIIIGKSSPWGQSFSKENYLNVLSNVIIDNISNLLENSRFLFSLGKKGSPLKSKGTDI